MSYSALFTLAIFGDFSQHFCMSHPIRPSIGSQPSVPGRMIPPVCSTGPSPIIPVVPNSYGLVPGQPHHYVPHTTFTQNLPNIPNRLPVMSAAPASLTASVVPISATSVPMTAMPITPAPIPRMYVPVSPMTPNLSSPTIDPAKLLEEQRRLEKERNFQLQQLRLKQFTIAGKKGNINAENLIDSMFGKVQPKFIPTSSTSSTKPPETNASVSVLSSNPPRQNIHCLSSNVIKKEISSNTSLKLEKKDKKELDAMMLECSNLSGPQKANKFSKPVVKELAPSAQLKCTFAVSDKARDWKNLQGLDEVFVAKPRFPAWCSKENVPELYRQVEAVVTSNNSHMPDTKLLFPVFLSSGLPHPVLGQIWELVNHSAPGYLTVEEMYAALALIAIVQTGHPVTSVDILHQLPACPIPQLQYFTKSPQATTIEEKQPDLAESKVSEGENIFSSTVAKESSQSTTHQVLRPSAISLTDVTYSSTPNFLVENSADCKTVSGNSAAAGSGFISSPDDEFDDFKSATPTAVNFSMQTPTSDSVLEDEFADFQQAPPTTSSLTTSNDSVSFSTIKPTTVAEQDLMSPEEDKYSVFRALQGKQNEEPGEWGDFSDATSNLVAKDSFVHSNTTEFSSKKGSDFQSNSTVLENKSGIGYGLFGGNHNPSENITKDETEFGDFLHAVVPSSINVASVNVQLENLNANFADFTNFKETEMPSEVTENSSQLDDDEFGEFASSLPVTNKPDIGHDFLFHHLKDNISLAESQSVSSLELGTFDGGGHSGESKSSLSRQGSIPSLDLKSTYIEGTDNDEFGEFQAPAFVNRGSKSPSPAKDIKASECNNMLNNSSLGLPFQSSRIVPLTDKYSVIRAEERKEEDQHISCWTRCLQSCVDILQNTKKIFNQMSCSSVCNEVLQSEQGENYIKDVIEVYKIVRRIATSSKFIGKQTVSILDMLKEADVAWHTICGFFAGSSLMPAESALEFTSAIFNTDSEDNTKACGLCLLNVEAKVKYNNKVENLILSYGGRNYHSPCANLWVNCVDPLLPALTLPQLL